MRAICTVQRRYKSLPSFNLFFHHRERDSYTCPITHCQQQYERPINNVFSQQIVDHQQKKSRYQTKACRKETRVKFLKGIYFFKKNRSEKRQKRTFATINMKPKANEQ